MGGSIGVDSMPGRGSTFWFTVRMGRRRAALDTSVAILPGLRGVRVLCVDDHATNRMVLEAQLGAWEMRADSVADGPTALATLRAAHDRGHPYALAILAMTANAMKGDAERCLAAGMDDYMSKPVKLETIAVKLPRWVSPAAVSSAPGGPAGETPDPLGFTDAPPLDAGAFAALSALGDGDAAFLADIVRHFTEEASTSLSALLLAASTGDAAALGRAAHTLASVSGNIGAPAMAALCRTLQGLAREGTVAAALEDVARLAAEFERVRQALAEQCPLPV
jgi:CheY-like chemotaxis protein